MSSRDLAAYETTYQNHNFEVVQSDLRRNHILSFLQEANKKKILEIGCGLKPLFQSLDQFDLFHVVEPSGTFYKNALSQAENNPLKHKIKIYKEYLETFEPETNYNVIVCTALLHEVEDDVGFLKAIKKICKKDTLLYLNTINVHSFHRLLALEAGLIKSVHELSNTQKKLQQSRTYSIKELKELVDQCGFEIIKSESIIFKPFTHHQMMQLLQKEIITSEIVTALSNMVKYFPNAGSELSFILKIK